MKTLYLITMLFALSACGSDKDEPAAKDETPVARSSTKGSSSSTTTSHSSAAKKTVDKEQEEADKAAEAYDGIVYIETGAIQCQAQGVTYLETAQLLIDNGIEVLESRCADLSGVSVIAQCGAAGLDINVHVIPPESHARALSLGFKSTADLKRDDDTGYTEKDCKSVKLQYQ